jgi:hypothetical protein
MGGGKSASLSVSSTAFVPGKMGGKPKPNLSQPIQQGWHFGKGGGKGGGKKGGGKKGGGKGECSFGRKNCVRGDWGGG